MLTFRPVKFEYVMKRKGHKKDDKGDGEMSTSWRSGKPRLETAETKAIAKVF